MEDLFLLNLSDWNMQDKYYHVPRPILQELRKRVLEAHPKPRVRGKTPWENADTLSNEVWEWFIGQVDYGQDDDKGKPVLFANHCTDHTLEELFIDWCEPHDSVKEWDEFFGPMEVETGVFRDPSKEIGRASCRERV